MHHVRVFEAEKQDSKAFKKIPWVDNLITILGSHESRFGTSRALSKGK